MKIENIVLIVGGVLLIVISLGYLSFGMINQVCNDDNICIPAMLIVGSFLLGNGFIAWGLTSEVNKK